MMMLTQHPSASMRREAPPHHMPSPRTAPFYPSTPQDSAPLPLHTTRQRPSTHPPLHTCAKRSAGSPAQLVEAASAANGTNDNLVRCSNGGTAAACPSTLRSPPCPPPLPPLSLLLDQDSSASSSSAASCRASSSRPVAKQPRQKRRGQV